MPATLFDEVRLGPRVMRNRLMHLAVNPGYADGYQVGDRLFDYWRARAVGGVGAIVSGLTPVHPSSLYKDSVIKNTDESDLPALERFAEAVGEPGALSIVQLVHNGAQLVAAAGAPLPVSPSGRAVAGLGQPSIALTRAQIAELVVAFAAAAGRARRAGVSGVEVHGAHGFLIHQFLSPLTNVRCDSYGGSRAARMSFAIEVLDAVRQQAGADLIVGFRLVADECAPGGITVDDAIATAQELCDRDLVDYLSVSAGNYGSLEHGISPWTFPTAPLAELCGRIRAAVSVPVVVANRITTPQQATDVLDAGQADVIGLGRALVADPSWVRHAAGNLPIRPCISVNACFAGGGVTTSAGIECAVNPALAAGTERQDAVGPPSSEPAVLVVGAGVAGLTFAVEATRLGHQVRVVEAGREPGGQLLGYDQALTRGRFSAYVDWAVNFLDAAGVPIEFDCEIGPVELAELVQHAPAADVVLAIGSVAREPAARVFGDVPVRTVEEVLAAELEQRVIAVVGTGEERESLLVAHHLAERGHQVHLVTSGEQAAPHLEALTRRSLLTRFAANGGQVWTNAVIAEGTGAALNVRNRTGQLLHTIADAGLVASSAGRTARPGPAMTGIRVHRIGDCRAPADIVSATRQAYRCAHDLAARVPGAKAR